MRPTKSPLPIPERLDAPERAKRFYTRAEAAPRPDGGFGVDLDGRAWRSPAKREVVLPSEALARAVADEWAAQETHILPETMPLTALVATAADRVGPERGAVAEQIAAYAASDLVCYRADAPPDLVRAQAEAWDPLLAWMAEALEAPLETTAGIVAVDQPAASLAAVARAVKDRDVLALTALSVVTAGAGSVVIGLALIEGRIDAEAAFLAAHVDEMHQSERWGRDREAEQRLAAIRRDFEAAERALALARTGR